MKPIYSITSVIMAVGGLGMLYGIHTETFSIFIEGVIVLWLGFSITAQTIEYYRLEELSH